MQGRSQEAAPRRPLSWLALTHRQTGVSMRRHPQGPANDQTARQARCRIGIRGRMKAEVEKIVSRRQKAVAAGTQDAAAVAATYGALEALPIHTEHDRSSSSMARCSSTVCCSCSLAIRLLNLNIHLHCLVLDGVYRCDAEGEPVIVEVPAPTDEALQTVLQKVITRLMKLLTRRGVLVEEQGQTYVAESDGDSDEARTLRPLQAAAWPCSPRRASGPAPRQAQTVHWTV